MVAAGGLIFRNCASLAAPWSGVACDEAGAELELEKTVKGQCIQGQPCTFTLTVTNTGNAPFAGNVLWTDGMTIAGPAVVPVTAISPSLGCSPDPASLPFSCTAPLLLAAGASVSHDITVTMPADPAGYTAKNCFAVTDPALAPANPADPFGGAGPFSTPGVAQCVDVDVLPAAIMPAVYKPTSATACIPGLNEVRTSRGACVCKSGTTRWKGRCVATSLPKPVKPKLCTPGHNEFRNAYGQCVCEYGTVRNHKGLCVSPPKDEKHCPHGTFGKYPHCKPIEKPKCPHGTTGLWPICKKIEDKRCPKGTYGEYPNCKPIETPKCPVGTTGIYPNCKKFEDKHCPKGTYGKYPVASRSKSRSAPRERRASARFARSSRTKHCPRGTIGKYPNCRPIVVPKCPSGTTGVFPNCRKIDTPKCPKGTIGTYPICKSSRDSEMPARHIRQVPAVPQD